MDLVEDFEALLHDSGALLAETRGLLGEARSFLDGTPAVVGPPDRRASGLTRPKRKAVRFPAAVGLVLLGTAFALLAPRSSHRPAPVAVSSRPQEASGPHTRAPASDVAPGPQFVPLWLSIPRLQSQATVDGPVDVIASGPEAGLLTAPPNYHDLGWFRQSAAGLLVLDGHVGYRADPGPLAFIGSLHAGDVVLVGNQSGEVTYTVEVVATALKGQLPAKYFSPAYGADLMLITCDYESQFSNGHFADNVYVVAQRVA